MNELVISLPDLVRRWQTGWGLAKGLSPAEEARGGLRVLLIACVDGQHLHSALGWLRRATILIARTAKVIA